MFEGILKSEIGKRANFFHFFEAHNILQGYDLWEGNMAQNSIYNKYFQTIIDILGTFLAGILLK